MRYNKICLSFGKASLYDVLEATTLYKYIELRLDYQKYDKDELLKILKSNAEIIVTDPNCTNLDSIKFCLENGASYIDINVKSTKFEYLIELAEKNNTKTIISYHNNELTPLRPALQKIIRTSINLGASICKIVCKAETSKSIIRLMRLYNNEEVIKGQIQLISFTLGEESKISRLNAIAYGAPFMYCSPDNNTKTGEGQFTASDFIILQNLIQI